ncbi:MAG: TonB-dependent receptor, partial [Crocinitomicaceae bacterium]
MIKYLLFNILLILPCYLFSQVNGRVLSMADSTPIGKAKIVLTQPEKTIQSDSKGYFQLDSVSVPNHLSIKHPGFKTQTITVGSEKNLTIYLQPKEKEINTIVVSAGRKDQKIEEIPISIEIIKPQLIANKGLSNLAEAVDQSPGVYVMDGQVSIRGGGGYAYGAGSRVLLLWNGIPMLSPDVGDAKWNAVPMEQASQIEILKGASSVLYGSGALNGIIGLNEREPDKEGKLEAKIQSGIYDNPRRASIKWWSRNPTFHMADVYYGKSSGPFGYTIGANAFYNEAYRMGEMEKRVRINGSFYYRPVKENANLKAGISYNLQYQDVGVFVLWKNDSMCYQAMDNTLSRQKAVRFNIDPYLKFIDKNQNKHFLRTRYYLVTTGNDVAVYDASFAQMYYGDYQFQRKLKSNGSITLGATNTLNNIKSWVFGDHVSENAAAYSQLEIKRKAWDFTTGIRLEYCKLDTLEEDSKFTLGAFSSPVYPILRAGIHWEP